MTEKELSEIAVLDAVARRVAELLAEVEAAREPEGVTALVNIKDLEG